MTDKTEWLWWAGTDEEYMTIGPCNSKEEAIEEAINDELGLSESSDGVWSCHFMVVEAQQKALQIADWVRTDRLIDDAEASLADSDRTGAECDDGPWFDCTNEQAHDFEDMIKQACSDWQKKHILVFECKTFSAMRNQEDVCIPIILDRTS